MDAVKLGGRVYHASCHAEVKKEGGNTPLRTGTPDSVLGKRKAGVGTRLLVCEFGEFGANRLVDFEW